MSSEVLKFVTDSPTGQPPFTLLADVTITGRSTAPTPEPASLLLLTTGLLGLGGALR